MTPVFPSCTPCGTATVFVFDFFTVEDNAILKRIKRFTLILLFQRVVKNNVILKIIVSAIRCREKKEEKKLCKEPTPRFII
jgi:hypothetical protein